MPFTDSQAKAILDLFPPGIPEQWRIWRMFEIRLPRATNNLCDLHRQLPFGAVCLRVRYTRATLIALYKL